jgi:catechol 2,3-dioxygenase-like lactoylglutathione lyase family enzyme
MKRFHIHVSVDDLARNIRFYSTLFGTQPSRVEPDYAKWMLDDPRVNFAISFRSILPTSYSVCGRNCRQPTAG